MKPILLRAIALMALLFAFQSTATASTYPYAISVAPDYTVYRNGPLDANLTWVIEKDGVIVLQRNARYNMHHRIYMPTVGSKYRVWLNETLNGQVSNIIEVTVGETFSHQLSVDSAYGLTRSGSLGESLTWVIEKDGFIALERDATNELSYMYSGHVQGSHVRAWLKQSINGQYQRVSNCVEYVVGGHPSYEISIDQSHRVVRTGYQGEPVLWRIERDGVLQNYVNAMFDLQWVDYEHAAGSSYTVTLVADDGVYTRVSNTIQYSVDDIPTTYSLMYDGTTLMRSGSIGDPLTWVIEQNGRITLERVASNELEFTPWFLPGTQYRFWLTQFISGGYQRVSNIIVPADHGTLPPPPMPEQQYFLSLAQDYTVYRNGTIDADLTWVFEKDGMIVLQSNAKYDMQERYHLLTPGSAFRIWLNDVTGTQVSNTVEFTVGETFNYELYVDPMYGLFRSGAPGEDLIWVIEQDGVVVFEQSAVNDVVYTYHNNTPGSYMRAWLIRPINGKYRRVSNYVSYFVGGLPFYEISIDQSHRVMRTGYLGEPVMWRIEKDGVFYVYADAVTNLQWVDYENIPLSTYAVTLVTADGTDTPVSNTVLYTVDDIPINYSIDMLGDTLLRSGNLGEPLTWVIEENGYIVLERNASDEIQFAPAVIPGLSYRFWLTQFIDGGYQRVSNIITIAGSGSQPPSAQQYSLNVGVDYTAYRNGPLDAGLTWVVEKDGIIVLQSNAKYSLHERYFSLTPGSHFRIWLNDVAGMQASNIVEYTVDETYTYYLYVDPMYGLFCAGMYGEDLTWVIEKDGMVVSERTATCDSYMYDGNTPGSHFRAWLTKSVNGQAKRVSNFVEYIVGGQPAYEISIDQTHRVVRTGYLGAPLMWRIERDGEIYMYEDASMMPQWINFDSTPGVAYAITLVAIDEMWMETPVSNTVTYIEDDIPTSHSLSFINGVLGRSGVLGEELIWVIEEAGHVSLQRDACNEMEFTPALTPYMPYRFWLVRFIDGGYQRVSNIVTHW